MSELLEITWSAGSIDEARKVSRLLIQERLAACAQLIPWIESIYLWNNQLEVSQESRVVLKAKKEHLEAICAVIKENTKYEIPEILWRKIEGGLSGYLKWIEES
jgi:periplasmic divalent cation tolerance protein